ncbi:hypothetical protein GCM10010339_29170 [Streptomyces alanosinicus]|uniref:Uncharacterized protein n=1 Tax=Streptomyces alanosinicus TaxID=68171 RepID=A0A918YGP6_9ACTN|nr:hypothetical protein GCM10010339_29170 [Streptomyces alanosinicus]
MGDRSRLRLPDVEVRRDRKNTENNGSSRVLASKRPPAVMAGGLVRSVIAGKPRVTCDQRDAVDALSQLAATVRCPEYATGVIPAGG